MPKSTLPSHLHFHPAPAFVNFGERKYATFDAMLAELAWLLDVEETDIRQIDNSDIGDGDHDDDLALWGGAVIGSFWQCPFEAPKRALAIAAE